MRLQIHLESDPNQIIPFNHQPALAGVINKWLGANNVWHGKSSLFSFSRLNGGTVVRERAGLVFNRGAQMFFSACDAELIKTLLGNLRNDPVAFNGLVVREVLVEEEPALIGREIFYPASPILLKKVEEGGNIRHVVYTDPDASEWLTHKFRAKLLAAGYEEPFVRVSFAPMEGVNKTQLIAYRGVKNRVSWCPIRIEAEPEVKLFAWNSGLGNSTGIGFGAIR